MTATYQIAEVARRGGLPASTLRYYEDVGLVAPAEAKDLVNSPFGVSS